MAQYHGRHMEQRTALSPAMREVIVETIRAAGPGGETVMLLREKDGTRRFPVWIGVLEASAIAIALEQIPFPRPLTHDLFIMTLARLETRITGATITGMALGTFFAEITIEQAGKTGVLDARPSDAVALALRANAPIRAAEELFVLADEKGKF